MVLVLVIVARLLQLKMEDSVCLLVNALFLVQEFMVFQRVPSRERWGKSMKMMVPPVFLRVVRSSALFSGVSSGKLKGMNLLLRVWFRAFVCSCLSAGMVYDLVSK